MTYTQACAAFGAKIRQLMADKGISRENLSELTQLELKRLGTYIDGERAPMRKEDRNKLANALGVKAEHLFAEVIQAKKDNHSRP